MLTASAAYASLRVENSGTVGVSKLERGLDLDALLDAYQDQVRVVGKQSYEVDVPDTYLESAWIGDWEASYDIAAWQALEYARSVAGMTHPAWTAVTGYYAAFFAARSLLYALGSGHRSFPKRLVMPAGLYSLTIAGKSTVGTTTLACRAQGGGGSHKLAWKGLDEQLRRLALTGGLDLRSVQIISQLRSLISTPRPVSSFRNSVNYSLEIASNPVPSWNTYLTDLSDAAALEAQIYAAPPARGEQRLELATLACLSWLKSLHGDYLLRTKRPDRRRADKRRSLPAAPGPEQAARAWF